MKSISPVLVVALTLWLAGCNNQQPPARGLPAPEVTVSKPKQKEVVTCNEFTGRTAAVTLVNVTPRVSRYIVDIPFRFIFQPFEIAKKLHQNWQTPNYKPKT